ncbi:hypothetical protein A3K93_00095 [Acinetobacter sp. NCu2D-2]|uniref:hypothetical protein n=1 Tax=Acinetobacter sp. NCu2D-2 TaxID=1608473 RepID=UPI0007CDAB60|nr:hypothetical protein [Acinetobacter sp. NCu2D-2]ANF80746.1 hypothetical protein A3K93_00095 [Acinetobacter sp. NCu2D-2]
MDTLTRFIIEVVIALVLSGVTVFLITSVLRDLLVDLCGDLIRAKFWERFSIIMLFITPLMFVLFFGVSFDADAADHTVVKRALGWSLFGIFCAILAMAFQVSKFIPSDKVPLLKQKPFSDSEY